MTFAQRSKSAGADSDRAKTPEGAAPPPKGLSSTDASGRASARGRDDRKGGDGGDDPDRLDRDAPALAEVDEDEHQLAECERTESESREEAESAQVGSRLVGDGIAQLERPVAELRDREEGRPEHRGARIEDVPLDGEHRGVLGPEHDHRGRNRGRNAQEEPAEQEYEREPTCDRIRGSEDGLVGGESEPDRDRARGDGRNRRRT